MPNTLTENIPGMGEEFSLDRDGVENRPPDRKTLRKLQRSIVAPALRGGPITEIGKRLFRLSEYMWIAILDDLLDRKIAINTFKNRGHLDGDERIGRTRDFFLTSMVAHRMEDIDDFVNLVHELAGVCDLDEDGPRVTAYYEESFLYVLSSLIERMRDYYERELRISRGSERGKKLAQDLCDFWYGIAHRVGLRRRPASIEDHEAFVVTHEGRIIPETEQDGETQDNIHGMAERFLPMAAKISNTSLAEFVQLLTDVRPTLARLLHVDAQAYSAERPQRRSVVAETLRYFAGRAQERVRRVFFGPSEDEKTLAALRGAAIRPDAYPAIRAIYHLSRLRPDIHFHRETIRLGEGEALIEEGTPPENLYVVLSCSTPLDVVVRTNQEETHLATIDSDRPRILGEMGMFKGLTQATVRARDAGTVEVIRIPRHQFQDLLKLHEGMWLKRTLIPQMQRRLKDNRGKLKLQVAQAEIREMEKDMDDIATTPAHERAKLHSHIDLLVEKIHHFLQEQQTIPEDTVTWLVSSMWELGILKQGLNGEVS